MLKSSSNISKSNFKYSLLVITSFELKTFQFDQIFYIWIFLELEVNGAEKGKPLVKHCQLWIINTAARSIRFIAGWPKSLNFYLPSQQTLIKVLHEMRCNGFIPTRLRFNDVNQQSYQKREIIQSTHLISELDMSFLLCKTAWWENSYNCFSKNTCKFA